MKGSDSIIRVLVVCAVSILHLALMPLALGETIEVSIPNKVSATSSPNHIHFSQDEQEGIRREIAGGGSIHPLHLVRHIRSVDHEQLPGGRNTGDLQEDNNSIQSNSDEEMPEAVYKAQKSFVTSEMSPTGVHNKWLFRGMGQSQPQQFPRGLRRDSHFIRFGRNSNLDFDGYNLASATHSNGNKKNNFIRLGRENPRRNNFIRLGRSGLWGSNERFGSKVGYFPDYYSQILQGNPNFWDFAQQQPVPFDPSDMIVQG